MRNFFHKMFRQKDLPKGFVFTTRNLASPTGNGDRIRRSGSAAAPWDGNIITIDSISQGWSTNTNTNSYAGAAIAVPSNYGMQASNQPGQPSDQRKAVEPKEVFDEIKAENTPEVSFENLDEKIAVVEERIGILKQHLDEGHLTDEHRALFYLKNRRAYLDTRKKNPMDWALTTEEAVDDLCKRYKLKIVPLKQFYTLVPKEGLKEMDRYTKAYKAITGDVPIYELVVKDTQPAAEERKKKDRDPILLANSPFGNHMFILGVWDEEVAVVDEIIYQGK